MSQHPALRLNGIAAGVLVAIVLAACGGGEQQDGAQRPADELDPAGYSARVDNPLFPLASTRRAVYEGRERDPETGQTIETRSDSRVLPESGEVAGIPATVVDVREFEDGELVEHTVDYYSQRRDGSVAYLGERVDDIEDGKVIGHEGQWFAGRQGAKPGLFMPADPKVGYEFEQERAPGVAEDRSRVVATGVEVTTPAGRFDRCITTSDYAPLDKKRERKDYCPGAGLVREQGKDARLALVSRG